MRRCDRPTVTLMLALAAGVSFNLLLPRSAAAETPVGLEAQGVDAAVALENAQQLDVRDELGRPVSAALIRKQLKQAEATAAADAAYASRLPQARRVTLMLELLSGLGTAIGAALERGFERLLADAALPRPHQKLPAFAVAVFTLALAAASVAGAVLRCPDLAPSRSTVLRC